MTIGEEMTKEQNTKVKRAPITDNSGATKTKRVPLSKQNAYNIQERPGYRRRGVNDDPMRIQAFLDAGWTIVHDKNQIDDDNPLQSSSQMGSVVRKVANRSPDAPIKYQILMEIPEELYQEDQLLKAEQADALEQQYDPKKRKGVEYGSGSIKKNGVN